MDVCCYPWLIAQGQKGAPVIQADRSPCSSPASTLGEHFRFLPYKRNRPLLPPKVWPERLTASSFLGQEWIFHPTCGSNRPTHDILPPPPPGAVSRSGGSFWSLPTCQFYHPLDTNPAPLGDSRPESRGCGWGWEGRGGGAGERTAAEGPCSVNLETCVWQTDASSPRYPGTSQVGRGPMACVQARHPCRPPRAHVKETRAAGGCQKATSVRRPAQGCLRLRDTLL